MSFIGIVAKLWSGQLKNCGLKKDKKYFPSLKQLYALGPNLSCSVGSRGCFLRAGA